MPGQPINVAERPGRKRWGGPRRGVTRPARAKRAHPPYPICWLVTTCHAEPDDSAGRRLRGSGDRRPSGADRPRTSPRRALRSPHTGPASAGGRVLGSAATAGLASDDASDSVSPPRARRRRCRALEPSEEPDLTLRRQCPIEGHDQRRQRVDRLVPGSPPAGAVDPPSTRHLPGDRHLHGAVEVFSPECCETRGLSRPYPAPEQAPPI